ncbi:hypothetical protein J6A31_04810 [bacterium]|nr:hypothetical protein [bacterium]
MSSFKDIMSIANTANPSTKRSVPTLTSLLDAYAFCITPCCTIDKSIIQGNLKMIDSDSVKFDRRVSFDSIFFVAKNFAVLLGMVLLDYDGTQQLIGDVINKEIEIDGLNIDAKRNMRESMADSDVDIDFSHMIEMGLTNLSNSMMAVVIKEAVNSLEICGKGPLAVDIDKALSQNDASAKIIIGILLSNFAYIMRAINHNPVFFKELASKVYAVRTHYGLPVA